MRHFQVEMRRLQLVWRTFRWSLLFTALVWGLSVWILHGQYPVTPGEDPMSWDRAAYAVLTMTAFNGVLNYHPHAPWLVGAVFFGLPLLGLFVIIDAIVRFTGILFQRRLDQKEWQELLASTYKNHVIVGGLGHVGYRIVEQLVHSETDCVVIEQSETPFVEIVRAMGVPVLIGDVRKDELLRQAQVERADAIIAATDVDLVNVETGLHAKEMNPAIRVVVRIFDQALAKRIEKLVEIDYAFSTSALAAPLFAAAATTKNVINSFVVEDTVLNTVELQVKTGAALEGRTLDSLRETLELTFLLLQTGSGLDWNPPLAHALSAGDKVWVVTTTACLRELEALNSPKRGLGAR